MLWTSLPWRREESGELPDPVQAKNDSQVISFASGLDPAIDTSRKGFSIRRVKSRDAQPHWSLTDGALQHKSKGFFSVTGVRDNHGERLMLYQPQGAINGMLTRKLGGERHFLFQARAEPGNAGEVQFGPTLQSTPANYLQFHGGKTSDFFPHFLQQTWATSLLSETTQLDLGSRYLQKTKRVIIAEATEDVPPVPSFYWLSPAAIRGGVLRDFEINTDSRALIAVSAWSEHPDAGELSPASPELRRSLGAPLRSDVIGEVLLELAAARPGKSCFVPIESLANWTFDEDGLHEIVPDQNVAVGFYAISARYREVGQWIQPLVTATGEGHSVLLARERDAHVEFLVPVIDEPGLATGRALAPTWQQYPGDAAPPPDWLLPHLDDVWGETCESDEGGRFIEHKSRFRIVRLTDRGPAPPEDAGHWLRLSELKSFLESSTRCTIQLRVISSHLLGLE
jgi:dTDP-4-dehydro-6-deoxy-alpha-D-glucopyranose 2,3-dehydratase